MPKLFSYGTLQQANVQLATFGRLLVGRPDTLLGYQLGEVAITDPYVIAKSGKTHHPMLIHTRNPHDKVKGVIFDITDDELDQADCYEAEVVVWLRLVDSLSVVGFALLSISWIMA